MGSNRNPCQRGSGGGGYVHHGDKCLTDFDYGTAECKICKKVFSLHKWHQDETICDSCKKDHA